MLTTAVLIGTLSLAPGQADKLTLSNVRLTHGMLGVPRADNKVLPGDTFVIAFNIEGVRTDDAGKARYSIGLDVSDSQGKVHFRQKPRDLEATTSLGGGRLPAFAILDVGLDQKPGDYTAKVTVTDRTANASRTLTRPFTILPKGFGLVRLTTTSDPDGRYPCPVLGEGQTLWVTFGVVGFARDTSKGQPKLTAQLRVLDDSGRPTVAKGLAGKVEEGIAAKDLGVPMQFLLALNRPGNFTAEISVADHVANKTAKLSIPLKVLPAK